MSIMIHGIKTYILYFLVPIDETYAKTTHVALQQPDLIYYLENVHKWGDEKIQAALLQSEDPRINTYISDTSYFFKSPK